MDETKIYLYTGTVTFYNEDSEEHLGQLIGYTYAASFSEAAATVAASCEEQGYDLFHLELTDCPPDIFYEMKGEMLQ